MPKKLHSLLLLLFLALPLPALAECYVLLYHRVGDSRYPTTNVSLEGFREEMKWFRDAGYTVVTTRALEDYLLRGGDLPKKSVVLQFDDALRTVYTNAFPVLKEYGYPFSVFVTTEPVAKGYPDYVTWSMLTEMVKAGAEIGVHGHSHQRMAGPEKGEGAKEFAGRINHELNESRRLLKEHGFASSWFAYTFGEYGPDLVAATKAAGYTLGFVQDAGAVDRESDPFLLNRFAVVGSVADSALLKERMTYLPLSLSERKPEFGLLSDAAPVVYSAKLAHPERYVAKSVNVFVSDLGRLEASFNPATGVVTASSGKKLRNNVNRVIVTIKDRNSGRFAFGSWAVILGNK